MKVVHRAKGIQKIWAPRRGLVAELDVGRSLGSSLRCKVLIFRTRIDMREFWNHTLRGRNGGFINIHTRGVVSCLGVHVINPSRGTERMEVDPTYFAVCALNIADLHMETLCHECVHIAFAYAARVKHRSWPGALDNDEENIAYPAGRISAEILYHIDRLKLLPFLDVARQ